MIPDSLPYREFRHDEVDVDEITWFNYILGEFTGEKWLERDDIDTSRIDRTSRTGYKPQRFPEEYTHIHERFFEALEDTNYFDDLPFNHIQNFHEEPIFHVDLHCRFDIWALYNYPKGDIELNCGGTLRIEARPEQKAITDVPDLRDSVPSDVPLIYGPPRSSRPGPTRLYASWTRPTPESRI